MRVLMQKIRYRVHLYAKRTLVGVMSYQTFETDIRKVAEILRAHISDPAYAGSHPAFDTIWVRYDLWAPGMRSVELQTV